MKQPELLNEVDAEKYFSDMDEVSDFAKKEVKALQSLGLLKGRGNDNFDPKAELTRAEMAIVLDRLVTLLTNSAK